MTDFDDRPDAQAIRDAQAVVARVRAFIADHVRDSIGARLARRLLLALGVGGAALYVLPIVVAVVGIALMVVIAIGAIYAYKELNATDRYRRHVEQVPALRLEQRALRAELVLQETILAIAGEGADRESRARVMARQPELARALRYAEHQRRPLAAAVAAERREPPGAKFRRPAEPRKADLPKVRRHRQRLQAEIAALEARIQAATLPDAQREREVQETGERLKALRQAALEAERLARSRDRRGLSPTDPTGEHRIDLSISSMGVRDVQQRSPAQTPEQIVQAAQHQAE